MVTTTPGTVTVVDRLYARAVSFGVYPPEQERAVRELVQLAGGDPHQLGRARMLVETVVRERPDSNHMRHGLTLLTSAWIRAIEFAER